MRIVNKDIKVFKFQELSEDIQNKIVKEEIDYMLDTMDYENISKNSNLYKAVKECEKMQTPWFIENYVWDYCQKDILKRLSKYEYEENGKWFN